MVLSTENIFKKEALLFTQKGHSKIQCETCWHHCLIPEGGYGRCQTRTNIEGTLYCINYGLISSFSINPIEKKPLFHYYPGSHASTIGSFSCNFSCPWCQNWRISKRYPFKMHSSDFRSPEELVKNTENNKKAQGISVSFNEPTLSLEYALDVFRLCKPETYRMFVTNGYMTNPALKLLIEAGMSGMSITVKGSSKTVKKYCKAKVERVWNNIITAYREGVHIEIICLIIPTVNDSINFFKQVATRLVNIDPNIPLHFTRFYPDYQFTEGNVTPLSTLEKAHQIAHAEGMNYVYLGNVPGHPLENTYCPKCQKLLIKRTGYHIERKIDLQKHYCPSCSTKIPLYPYCL
ncbi:MAG: AmmeMemoRadiSam system radical SAM enzyme [Promethearchaeota archaeon]